MERAWFKISSLVFRFKWFCGCLVCNGCLMRLEQLFWISSVVVNVRLTIYQLLPPLETSICRLSAVLLCRWRLVLFLLLLLLMINWQLKNNWFCLSFVLSTSFSLFSPTMCNISYTSSSVVLEPMCNRTWDGWLCWDDTKSGVVTEQHCPDYFQDFDPSGKICGSRSVSAPSIHFIGP